LPARFSQNSITWVTWPERALAAGASDELREKATQIRKIGTRIRKKCICGGPHNRSKPISQHPFSIALFGHVKVVVEGKTKRVQPIFFSQEIFVQHSKIKFRFLLVGFSRRF
jgi:hypothetical protein